MEGKWINVLVGTSCGIAGLGIGLGVGRFLASREYSRRLEAEVTKTQDHYYRRGLVAGRSGYAHQRAETPLGDDGDGAEDGEFGSPPWDPDGGANALAATFLEGGSSEVSADLEGEGSDSGDPGDAGDGEPVHWPPLNRDTKKPYVISLEEFSDVEEGWEQITITWFEADGVLVDDKETPIPNILTTIGPLSRESFGNMSEDPNILYIRNHNLQVDFEVILDARAYVDVILNYGTPGGRSSEGSQRT